MNKSTAVKIVCGAVAMIITVTASWAALSGSAHDFTGLAWSDGEICKPCHTPHNGQQTIAPLWAHEETASSFQVYTNVTMDAVPTQPDGISLACLSCHDGSLALNSFTNATNAAVTVISGGALFSTDLRNDHPVSFTYTDASTPDAEILAPATASGLGGTIATDLLDVNGKMQCSSCHDVHNTPNIPKMLRKSNLASALCLTCHDK